MKKLIDNSNFWLSLLILSVVYGVFFILNYFTNKIKKGNKIKS